MFYDTGLWDLVYGPEQSQPSFGLYYYHTCNQEPTAVLQLEEVSWAFGFRLILARFGLYGCGSGVLGVRLRAQG